jgi:hypothetical protein
MQVTRPLASVRPAPNLYPHLNFEPYRFVQFPEWVTPPQGGEPVLVNDEEEKAAILGGRTACIRDTDEKASLYAIAEAKGIVPDKRWSLDTLRAKVGMQREGADPVRGFTQDRAGFNGG